MHEFQNRNMFIYQVSMIDLWRGIFQKVPRTPRSDYKADKVYKRISNITAFNV
jgi:hypothetical protein